MSTLTLLRHGQAAFGAEVYDQLSPLGFEQSRATGAHFCARAAAFDAVITGPRQRHRLTAEQALAGLSAPAPIVNPALDEFAEGTQILRGVELRTGAQLLEKSTIPRDQMLRLYGEEIRLWSAGETEIPGAASAIQFRSRVVAWLDEITAEARPGQQVLAVTSAGVIGAVVGEVLGLPNTALSSLMSVIANGSLTTVLWSRHGCVLESFNQTFHLPPQLTSAI